MLGAIAGDIIGSIHEHDPIKHKDFALFDRHCTFTDDTVLTLAIAEAILTGTSYVECIRRFGRRYPDAGYGASFFDWLQRDGAAAYNSWGNGSAMRVSAVGFAFDSEDEVLRQARLSAQITHDHPEGIKGAQATALAVFLARTDHDKTSLRARIATRFGYDLDRTIDDIRPTYAFDVSCQGSVPEALVAFLDSHDYEDAVRNAVSLGGDADTQACIAGAVAEAFYGGVPQTIVAQVEARLTPDLLDVMQRFRDAYRQAPRAAGPASAAGLGRRAANMTAPPDAGAAHDPHDLRRFVDAQAACYAQMLAELQAGRKRTHWMWFVFPQLAGLGSSPTARRFAIANLAEARAYLAHPQLGARLRECAQTMLRHRGRSAHEILGSPDDLKLRSCATLFARVSPADPVFERLLTAFYDGERDARTLQLLEGVRGER